MPQSDSGVAVDCLVGQWPVRGSGGCASHNEGSGTCLKTDGETNGG